MAQRHFPSEKDQLNSSGKMQYEQIDSKIWTAGSIKTVGDETHDEAPSRRGALTRVILSGLRCILFGCIFLCYIIHLRHKYATESIDGRSPAWYPTPRGGTLDSWASSYSKAQKLVKRMSLPEKVNVTTGVGWSMGLCVGNTGPALESGFPSLCLQDGPLGLRFADRASAFPAGITTGATWNRSLIYERGRALGRESYLKGVNVLLGPSMGPLGRMPAGGRNWEGFGSDPVIQAVAASETIKGIQDEGVIATAKHYVLNEQEHFRQPYEWGLKNAMSSNLDDRTLHELYLWPFAESIRAGVGSVMCSYQMVNNSHACANSKILNGILRDELGFQGFVQSDWVAQRSGVASALAGLDMTMPGDGEHHFDGKSFWGKELTKAVLNGSVPMVRLNDMVTRIVASWYQLGQDDTEKWPRPPPEGDGGPNFSSWTDEEIGRIHHGSDDPTTGVVNKFVNAEGDGKDSHRWLARRVAAEGTILVKNKDNALPLSRHGSFSSTSGRRTRIGIFGEDAGEGWGKNACPDRGCNQGTLASGWGSGTADFVELSTPASALAERFDRTSVDVTSIPWNQIPFRAAPKVVRDQDICLVFANSDGGEGYISWNGIRGDRNDLNLQKGGDELIQGVAKDCGSGEGSTIVVIHAVGPTLLEKWVNMPQVKAVILANLPGEQSGNALADIIFGDINPSGKLPYTVGKSLADYGSGGQIMYSSKEDIPQQDFDEGLFIDYRHFDKHQIEPRFEFGFGLSYTTFEMTNIEVHEQKAMSLLPSSRPAPSAEPPSYSEVIPSVAEALLPTGFRRLKKYIYPYISSPGDVRYGKYPYPEGYDDLQPPSEAGGDQGGNPSLWDIHVEVKVDVKNIGGRAGSQVVQVYVEFPPHKDVEFPVRVLRQFSKVHIQPLEIVTVSLNLTRKDLSYWSVEHQNWVMPDGKFVIWVGESSRLLSPKAVRSDSLFEQ